MNKTKKTLELELKNKISGIKEILDDYKNHISYIKMLQAAGNFGINTKRYIYFYVIENYNVYGDDASKSLKNDNDRAIFIDCLVCRNKQLSAWYALKYIKNKDNIKNLIHKTIIRILLSNIPSADFENEILSLIQNYDYYAGNDFLCDYLKRGYSINKLMDVINVMEDDKVKQEYYSHLVYNFEAKVYYEKLSDEQKRILIAACLDIRRNNLAFSIMKSMNNPRILERNQVELILHNKDILQIYNAFGDVFKDTLLSRENYYDLLAKKDLISEKVISEIYIKCFNSFDDYKNVKYYLYDSELKKLTSIFISKKSNNVLIANDIIKSKNYDEKEYESLLIIIGEYGTADIIYEVLMAEKLNELQSKMLEKALLDTHDIQYISYYYFYKKRNMFLELFGSTLLFLSFVSMNKELFTNKVILNKVTMLIKEENKKYQDETNNNISMIYKRKVGDKNE